MRKGGHLDHKILRWRLGEDCLVLILALALAQLLLACKGGGAGKAVSPPLCKKGEAGMLGPYPDSWPLLRA